VVAGLACAGELIEDGATVCVLDSTDAGGGRVRTDCVEGFLLDRGFQVLATAYPEAQGLLNYETLELGVFHPGALVRIDGRSCGSPIRSGDLSTPSAASSRPSGRRQTSSACSRCRRHGADSGAACIPAPGGKHLDRRSRHRRRRKRDVARVGRAPGGEHGGARRRRGHGGGADGRAGADPSRGSLPLLRRRAVTARRADPRRERGGARPRSRPSASRATWRPRTRRPAPPSSPSPPTSSSAATTVSVTQRRPRVRPESGPRRPPPRVGHVSGRPSVPVTEATGHVGGGLLHALLARVRSPARRPGANPPQADVEGARDCRRTGSSSRECSTALPKRSNLPPQMTVRDCRPRGSRMTAIALSLHIALA
jgi:Flavin containing amine oxidoreductase